MGQEAGRRQYGCDEGDPRTHHEIVR
jgi:hypothetical protein